MIYPHCINNNKMAEYGYAITENLFRDQNNKISDLVQKAQSTILGERISKPIDMPMIIIWLIALAVFICFICYQKKNYTL